MEGSSLPILFWPFGADFNKNGISVGRLAPGDMQPYEQEA
jgi:hypothetical protein